MDLVHGVLEWTSLNLKMLEPEEKMRLSDKHNYRTLAMQHFRLWATRERLLTLLLASGRYARWRWWGYVKCLITFQKAEIVWAASASATSAFWKTQKYKLIPNWTRKLFDYLYLIIYKQQFLHSDWLRTCQARAIFCSLRIIYLCLFIPNCTWNHSITYTKI